MRHPFSRRIVAASLIAGACIPLFAFAAANLWAQSMGARNAKRYADIRLISTKVQSEHWAWASLVHMIERMDERELASPEIAGSPSVNGTDYVAGRPDLAILRLEAFRESFGKEYAFAASTRNGGLFQLGATMEADGRANAYPYLEGNYHPRVTDEDRTVQTVKTVRLGRKVHIGGFDLAKLRTGDRIEIFLGAKTSFFARIRSVSGDGRTITLDRNLPKGGLPLATKIRLASTESAGLLKWVLGTPVVSDGPDLPY